jgi:hypothetical protein
MSDITTKAIAIRVLGIYDVHAYERIKAFHMRLGKELERAFAEAVGGRVGGKGEVDVTTSKGNFEFCSSHNTKNASGSLVDSLRGQRVQATGAARPGYLSGEQFLELHDRDPSEADALRELATIRALASMSDQMRLPL